MSNWKKVENSYMFSKLVREDGEYSIRSLPTLVNGGYAEVSDKNGNVIEVMKTMKAAKEKYSI